MKNIKLLLLLPCLLWGSQIFAQNEDVKYSPLDISGQFKTSHLWRGIEVSGSALVATDIKLTDKSQAFSVGVWGGAAFNGVFKEFDYYLSYAKNGFSVALWDIYNFSPGASYNNKEAFNYVGDETGHFIDLSVGYQFQGSFPLSISWATVIFGRDRGIKNEQNLYSNYVSLGYPAIRNKQVNLDLGVSGVFAFNTESGSDANFYAHKAGIVNVNATVSKTLTIFDYKVPVAAMVMWNPVEKYANLQLSVTLF